MMKYLIHETIAMCLISKNHSALNDFGLWVSARPKPAAAVRAADVLLHFWAVTVCVCARARRRAYQTDGRGRCATPKGRPPGAARPPPGHGRRGGRDHRRPSFRESEHQSQDLQARWQSVLVQAVCAPTAAFRPSLPRRCMGPGRAAARVAGVGTTPRAASPRSGSAGGG